MTKPLTSWHIPLPSRDFFFSFFSYWGEEEVIFVGVSQRKYYRGQASGMVDLHEIQEHHSITVQAFFQSSILSGITWHILSVIYNTVWGDNAKLCRQTRFVSVMRDITLSKVWLRDMPTKGPCEPWAIGLLSAPSTVCPCNLHKDLTQWGFNIALSPVALAIHQVKPKKTKLSENKSISHEKPDLLLSKIIHKDCKFYGSHASPNHTTSKPKKPLEKSKYLCLSQTRSLGIEI